MCIDVSLVHKIIYRMINYRVGIHKSLATTYPVLSLVLSSIGISYTVWYIVIAILRYN